jgi:alanyl-tRNA synthetase
VLRGVFDQLGGKGGGTKDFARGGLADHAKASAALAVAESLLKQS